MTQRHPWSERSAHCPILIRRSIFVSAGLRREAISVSMEYSITISAKLPIELCMPIELCSTAPCKGVVARAVARLGL